MGFGNNIGLGMLMGNHEKTTTADFDGFMDSIKGNVPTKQALFRVKPHHDLWTNYLDSFPIWDKQEYTCRCCKKFIEDFGTLVYIDHRGNTRSALWDTSKDYGYFNTVVKTMARLINGRPVVEQFFTKDAFLGRPVDGGWTHLAVDAPEGVVTRDRLKTAEQTIAMKKEEFRMLNRALDNYSYSHAKKALAMLKTDTMYRSEKAMGIAEWFVNLHEAVKDHKNVRANVVWSAVAHAPVGFAHVNSSVLGSILDDIKQGYNDSAIESRFATKMNPLQYRRPQTAPGAQNIKRGEEIIKKLGLERSLERRYATLEDLDLLWSPRRQKTIQAPSMGIFGGVQARNDKRSEPVQSANSKATVMTFSKFEKKVLPTAESIKVQAPSQGSYSALCTATHSDAPNILQWSNPVSWYVYGGGSSASQWGLRSGQWTTVTGICLQPNMWKDEADHQGEAAHFLLEGCKDSRSAGLALFPEILDNQLHEIRKTIESYSSNGRLTGKADSNANGIKFGTGATNLMVKVVSNGVETLYKLDRMD